jgi:phage terminase Nu1 subunit (DNA packaging protein)
MLSVREYARRRGVALSSVQEAIKSGRLMSCVAKNPRTGRVEGIISKDLADAEWARNTDATKIPVTVVAAKAARAADASGTAVSGVSARLVDERARKERTLADLAELKLKRLRGQLVEVRLVQNAVVGMVVEARTKLLGVPTRLKNSRPSLTLDDIKAVDLLIREVLEDLADGGASRVQRVTGGAGQAAIEELDEADPFKSERQQDGETK